MDNLQIVMAGLTAIILFVFGLEHFSREIEKISGERFRKGLGAATRKPVMGVAIGALVTGLIQSSSATSVIAISLVNAGVLSFKNSVGIIFGANIGTTVTAQLVAFKLTAFAPLFIIIGFALSFLQTRISIFGKAIFYFGFVFFSLNLIAASLEPLQNNTALVGFLTGTQNPLLAILAGCLFTAAVQSSSVTTGLAIIFTQQGLLSLENAVPMIMGANIGTTITALIAMFNMDVAAKKTAFSHLLFNVGGVLLFTPALLFYGHHLRGVTLEPSLALAAIHLSFNLVTCVVFLVLINPFTRLVDRLMGESKIDFERIALPVYHGDEQFQEIRESLEHSSQQLFLFLQENYNVVTLSIETNYQGIYEAAEKRLDYIQFVKNEYLSYFSQIVTKIQEKEDSKVLLNIINQFDYLFQIHDSIVDLFNTKKVIKNNFIELKTDVIVMVRGLSSQTLSLFEDIHQALDEHKKIKFKLSAQETQGVLNEVTREVLSLLADPERRDAGALTNIVTYSQRLKDKLVNYYKMTKSMARELPGEKTEDDSDGESGTLGEQTPV